MGVDSLPVKKINDMVGGADGQFTCQACAHTCSLTDGQYGICKIRKRNNDGLDVPWGYVSSLANDPIEKKPLYHFMPGEDILSFGMNGCNFHCSFCQNWQISQVGRDNDANASFEKISPERLVELAVKNNCMGIAATYNEPFISIEWMKEIFSKAKAENLKTVIVSNGYTTTKAIQYLQPVLDAINIDLKCFSEKGYKELGGSLQPVLDIITCCYENNIWQEIVSLLIPGWNDSDAEITGMAEFIASLNKEIPWHLTAWYATYKQHGNARTKPETLLNAYNIAVQNDLKYVYTGNIYGITGTNTSCPECGSEIITRDGYLSQKKLNKGKCFNCGCKISGIWQ